MAGPRGRRVFGDERPPLGMTTGDARAVAHHARGARAVHRRRSATVRASGHDVVDRCRRCGGHVPDGRCVAMRSESGRRAMSRARECLARAVARRTILLLAVLSVTRQAIVWEPVVPEDARRQAARWLIARHASVRLLASRAMPARCLRNYTVQPQATADASVTVRTSVRRCEIRGRAVVAVPNGAVRALGTVGPGTIRLDAARRVGNAVATGRAVRSGLAVPSRCAVRCGRSAVSRQVSTGFDRSLTCSGDVLPTSTLGWHTVTRT